MEPEEEEEERAASQPGAIDAAAVDAGEEEEEDEDDGRSRYLLLRDFINSMRGHVNTSNIEELVTRLKDGAQLVSPDIEHAFRIVERGAFVPEELQETAYSDEPIRCERLQFNVSAPHMHAMCMENLRPAEGESFLDLGTGCGLLCAMGAFLVGPTGHAHGVDVSAPILQYAESAERNFRSQCAPYASRACTCTFTCVNGLLLSELGDTKYDCVCVGASCPPRYIPSLIALLKEGGRLVTPSGSQLLLIVKKGAAHTATTITRVMFGELIVPTDGEIILTRLREMERKREEVVIPASTMCHDIIQGAAAANSEEKQTDFSILKDCDKDVCLIVDGHTRVAAHRSVLVSRSPLFAALCGSGMRDAQATEYNVPNDISLEAVNIVVEYMYTDDASLTTANARDVHHAATYYQLDRLAAMAEKILVESIAVENVVSLLQSAVEMGSDRLRQACIGHMVRNFDEVAAHPSFETLEAELLVEVTAEACRQATWLRANLTKLAQQPPAR